MKFFAKYIYPWMPIAALGIVGILMLVQPNLERDLTAHRHRGLTTLIYQYVWSVPAGVIAILITVYLAYRKFQQDKAN